MIRLKALLSTNGKGLWSDIDKTVLIRKLDLCHSSPESDYGELRVYFDLRYWNINVHGLIYTDPQFLRELKAILSDRGYPVRSIDYSEQGMQGYNYVSLDVEKSFVKHWYKNS